MVKTVPHQIQEESSEEVHWTCRMHLATFSLEVVVAMVVDELLDELALAPVVGLLVAAVRAAAFVEVDGLVDVAASLMNLEAVPY